MLVYKQVLLSKQHSQNDCISFFYPLKITQLHHISSSKLQTTLLTTLYHSSVTRASEAKATSRKARLVTTHTSVLFATKPELHFRIIDPPQDSTLLSFGDVGVTFDASDRSTIDRVSICGVQRILHHRSKYPETRTSTNSSSCRKGSCYQNRLFRGL